MSDNTHTTENEPDEGKSELRSDGDPESNANGTSSELRSDGGVESEASDASSGLRSDGGKETGIVAPDDETPTWSERKARKTGLSRLTYEYFERARREDQDLREESDYVERDVLGFPTWPHEIIRNMAISLFFVGMMILIAAALPPHFGAVANPSQTPEIILPDWYLYWSFGLLHLDPINPELAILDGDLLMSHELYGIVANVVVVGAIAVVPFLNKGSARRPVEEPFWAAIGVGGAVFSITISALAIQNLIPISLDLLLNIVFVLPIVCGIIAYALLRTLREGYMYGLNRRYYMLRPPK